MNHNFIHPIETRYRTEIAKLFTEEKKLQNWMLVEAVLANVHAELGNIPREAAQEIDNAREKVKLERVKKIDNEIHHDLMAMVKALAEQCKGDAGNYIHLGATSYDIEDTALALQLKEALLYIKDSLLGLLKELIKLMEENKNLVCIGRTHGQHAIPTTYGMRFGVWAYEIDRYLERISETLNRISFGKMSGAVGTMASFGDKGIQIQDMVMKKLDLNPVLLANQIVQRDRHAELILLTSMIGQTLAKIARQQRILQRNEIGEMFEPFQKKQVGSSTMSQKRNPHKSERICSLARILKSNAITALDNMVLEDERDLTNSASERVIFPENFIFLDFMIKELTNNLKGIELNEENIKNNLSLTKGAILSEKIMLELVKRGIGRQYAHELLRNINIKARDENLTLKELLLKNKEIMSKFKNNEIDELLSPENYIGTAIIQVENLIKILKHKYKI